MTLGLQVCYTSLHSKPASALSLLTVWSHCWGNPGMTRCREMATLPAGYIPQGKVPSVSSSGSLKNELCLLQNKKEHLNLSVRIWGPPAPTQFLRLCYKYIPNAFSVLKNTFRQKLQKAFSCQELVKRQLCITFDSRLGLMPLLHESVNPQMQKKQVTHNCFLFST